MRKAFVCILAACIKAAGSISPAQPIVIQQRTAGTGDSAEFGFSLASTSKYFAVGAPYFDGSGGSDRGCVNFFRAKDFASFFDNLRNGDNARLGYALAGYKSSLFYGEPGGHIPGQPYGWPGLLLCGQL